MSIGGKILDFFTGGAGGELVKGTMKFIEGQFPDKLSEQDRLMIQLQMTENTRAFELKGQEIARQETEEFNQRIRDMEGTASDLKTIPVVGPTILFLRGCQRPFWGFATFWLDYIWLVKNTTSWTEQQQTALIIINALVLGFLFGERATKNVVPMLSVYMGKKNA